MMAVAGVEVEEAAGVGAVEVVGEVEGGEGDAALAEVPRG